MFSFLGQSSTHIPVVLSAKDSGGQVVTQRLVELSPQVPYEHLNSHFPVLGSPYWFAVVLEHLAVQTLPFLSA